MDETGHRELELNFLLVSHILQRALSMILATRPVRRRPRPRPTISCFATAAADFCKENCRWHAVRRVSQAVVVAARNLAHEALQHRALAARNCVRVAKHHDHGTRRKEEDTVEAVRVAQRLLASRHQHKHAPPSAPGVLVEDAAEEVTEAGPACENLGREK